MINRIASIAFTPDTMEITYESTPDPFTAWLLQASPSDLLEGGYLIAKTLDRTGLAVLRDYMNHQIDDTDRHRRGEAANAEL